MKRIITINLSGRVLQIEEPAYEQLQQYIASLRTYFSKEESREEIINDIEGRIAEQFYGLIQQGAACITEEHLYEIIAAMGKPEELADAEIIFLEMLIAKYWVAWQVALLILSELIR